jgi:hypothetical protein
MRKNPRRFGVATFVVLELDTSVSDLGGGNPLRAGRVNFSCVQKELCTKISVEASEMRASRD